MIATSPSSLFLPTHSHKISEGIETNERVNNNKNNSNMKKLFLMLAAASAMLVGCAEGAQVR
jgi:hypothetical protein